MSTLRRNVILALALAVGLVGGGVLSAVLTAPSPASQGIPALPDVVSPTAPSPSFNPTPVPSVSPLPTFAHTPAPVPMPTAPSTAPSTAPPPSPPIQPAPTERPPRDSVQTPARYLTANNAARVTWDDVVDAGRPIPTVNRSCATAWRSSGKDRAIDWTTASYRCLDRLPGPGFKPQGVAGSGTAKGYTIGGLSADDRNLVLTSWYSRSAEKGLIGQTRGRESVTRLVVMDLDRGRYNTIELVRTAGPRRFRNLDSHGSGLVWAGQYLYSSSRSALWMYNADDILNMRGRFVLPAVAGWSVSGTGGLSSISIDRSTTPNRLTAIDYSKDDRASIQSFDLAPDGLLTTNSDRSKRGLSLRNSFGQGGRVVHSADTVVIDGASYQGVATTGSYALANSSALRFDGNGPVDATVVLKNGRVGERFRMPDGNVQSIYIDPRRGTYTTVTENFSQFLFTLPLSQLTGE